MTTCYSEKFGVYHNDVPLPGDIVIPDAPSSKAQWIDGVWVFDLSVEKAAALAKINETCACLLAGVKAGYPGDEVQSWSKQESEARAYAADNTVATPLLTAMSTARQIELPDLATRIIEKADLFAVVSGQIIGRRQLREDQINVATTTEAVLAIVW